MNKQSAVLMDETPGAAGASTPVPASTKIRVKMDDGREVEFGEKTKMLKDYSFDEATGLVSTRIDFSNGRVVEVKVDPASPIGRQAMGHGLAQKLGDAAAGAETIDDAYESVLELAARVNKGEWTKVREGGGTAKGSSELLQALVIVLSKTADEVRAMLTNFTPAEKTALRATGPVAAEIEKIRAAKPNTEKAKKGDGLLAALLGGAAPAAPTEAPAKKAKKAAE
jgi:hypothetical protein